MEIKKVSLFRVKIPFKHPFKHASAERRFAENIIVRCESKNGFCGWGETIAREYVTGETLEGTLNRYKKIPGSFWRTEFKSADDIENFARQTEINGFNAAKCGIETALLDLLSRIDKKPLYKYISENLPEIARVYNRGDFYYGGAIGLSSLPKTMLNALKMRLYALRKVKLKLEKDKKKDIARLSWVRRILGNDVDLRIDANEAWDLNYSTRLIPFLKKYNVSAVEQPFSKHEFELNKTFCRLSGIPVILDESLCNEYDVYLALENNLPSIFCVKLPKMGGFYNSLNIFKIAYKNDIPIQLSCQVGESAILSAAGRHLAALCPGLLYLEGSFDRYLLKENLSTEDTSFGFGGRAELLRKPGLGIEIDIEKLNKLTIESMVIFP